MTIFVEFNDNKGGTDTASYAATNWSVTEDGGLSIFTNPPFTVLAQYARGVWRRVWGEATVPPS